MPQRKSGFCPVCLIALSSVACATQRAAAERPPVAGPAAAAAPGAGHVTNRMHPGDPIQQVIVAGFSDLAPASAFIAASFDDRTVRPVFLRSLARGERARFADAAHPLQPMYLVFYFRDEGGRPVLLSLTRAHTDIPLAIGSIGYQFLLTVDAGAPEPEQIPVHLRDD
jgi:hypothetical protein